MKCILGEMFLGWKRDAKLVFLLLGLCVAGLFCIGTAGSLLLDTAERVGEYKEAFEDVQFYSILDHFVGDAAAELDKEENNAKFRKFLDLLSESKFFEYYMVYEQPVYVAEYRGKENNLYGYEQGKDMVGEVTDITDEEGNIRKSVPLKTFWLGDQVMDSFGLQLSGGIGFGDDDFILRPDSPISVILGANYADAYKVGDRLFVSFVFAKREAEVVGFLQEGAGLYYRGEFRSLDNYVIMPIFENDSYEGKNVFKVNGSHFYTLRNSGVIASRLSAGDVQEIVTEYAAAAGFDNPARAYYVMEYSGVTKHHFESVIEMASFLALVILAAAAVVICTLIIACTLHRVKRNRKCFAVLMQSGCGKISICAMLLLEEALLFGVAALTAGILYGTAARSMHLDNAAWGNTVLLGGLCFALLCCPAFGP